MLYVEAIRISALTFHEDVRLSIFPPVLLKDGGFFMEDL